MVAGVRSVLQPHAREAVLIQEQGLEGGGPGQRVGARGLVLGGGGPGLRGLQGTAEAELLPGEVPVRG